MWYNYFFLLCIVTPSGFGLNILGVFPFYGYSQYLLGTSLMEELAKRGHQVTVIAPFRQDHANKNYTEVYVDEFDKIGIGKGKNRFELYDNYLIKRIPNYYQVGLKFTEMVISSKAVQKFLASNQSFDLVICEQFVSESLFGFAWYFKAPLIVFSSIGPSEWMSDKSGTPLPFSYIPHAFSGYNNHMNFFQRFRNFFIHFFDYVYRHAFVYPKQNELAQRYFPGIPHLDKIMYNVSVFLTNSHVALSNPVPIMGNVIEVGGLHVSPKKLPEDLQKFLDEAKHGAVYFSMGSLLKGKDLPSEYKQTFIKAFSKLKQKVLWKFEDDDVPEIPQNVLIRKWFPQQDILAHPNIKVFITHGGFISQTEASFLGVPQIAIPIFGDQKMNVAKTVRKGTTILLEFDSINQANVDSALQEILGNPRYREAAKRLSNILNDQQIKPIDRAVYWIEYVHRQNGTTFLKPASLDLSWYQYYGLDIILSVLTALFSIIILFHSLFLRNAKDPKKKKD